ncbi:MAG: class I SAM-dependent methyltransferase [Bacteroidia bacterium]|nr:class I SAM-dependent methyltransferase [Bacteroidia bacterium]
MRELSDKEIIKSWELNARPWNQAIENKSIESRTLLTNQAIIDAILDQEPKNFWDLGCGEGWLSREIAKKGIATLGTDVVPDLLEIARKKDHRGSYTLLAYEELEHFSTPDVFDLICCNFSLIGKESVEHLFVHIASFLAPRGKFIIQTLHPKTSCGEEEYEDGWRKGSWAGFSEDFCRAAPWYFRTIDSWKQLYLENGFSLIDIREPIHPKTNLPASIIFIGEKS